MHNKQGFRWIWLPTRLAIYARDGWRCLACGVALAWKRGRGTWEDVRATAASLDHVDRAGGNSPANLVTVCVGCNSSRQDRAVCEWRPELAEVFAAATAVPIDRATGRELTRRLAPRVLANMAARNRRRPARARSSREKLTL